jgi:DNA topoisomerase I
MSAKNLVIVESPGKIKSISSFLGKDYKVMASFGHVRDLPKSKMGIDTEKNFKPKYLVSKDKLKVIKGLNAEIGDKTKVWIATDEDREGEAIGWHLVKALKLDEREVKRIVFHEITKQAILDAVGSPRKIDMNRVDAQQARRILDRLVGYSLSPLLWKKIKYGLSAGRVQSVAVRLIVEREREIEAFNPEEYWSIIGDFLPEKAKKGGGDSAGGAGVFEAKLLKQGGKAWKVDNEKDVKKVLKDLKGAEYEVTRVEKKEVKRNPAPPFITSTLQQEAARKLGFSVKKTMMLAQRLYEGADLKHGDHGLITYMRTDSVNLSKTALGQAKKVITKLYGKEFALEKPRYYKGKKGAQEAHEAIRPTDLGLKPEDVKTHLGKDEYRLYELIWKRALACQMAQAVLDRVSVDIEAKEYLFRATGQTVKFAGFIEVYTEGKDHDEEKDDHGDKFLPELEEGEKPECDKLSETQHFTKPPARYTEASLVKKLEGEGIGRPSTYAPTISTVQARGYIEKADRHLKPTDIGMLVSDFLVEHFPKILDYKFTIRMEDMLDEIEEGKEEWEDEIKEFYEPFHKLVDEKMETIKKEDVITEESDEVCEKCGEPMQIKFGRFGKFLSCSGFPECKNAKPLGEDGQVDEEKEKETKELEKKFSHKKCKKCGASVEVKTGRFGAYLACSKYPQCKTTESIVKIIGVKCPECGGEFVERHTRRGGKPFYGCNKFPKCKMAVWEKPTSSEHAAELRAASDAKAAKKGSKGGGKKKAAKKK